MFPDVSSLLKGIDPVTYVLSTTIIIALVERVKKKFPSISGSYTLLLAMGIGAIIGYLRMGGVDIYHGIIIGISAVGVFTTASADRRPKGTVSEVSSEPMVPVAN